MRSSSSSPISTSHCPCGDGFAHPKECPGPTLPWTPWEMHTAHKYMTQVIAHPLEAQRPPHGREQVWWGPYGNGPRQIIRDALSGHASHALTVQHYTEWCLYDDPHPKYGRSAASQVLAQFHALGRGVRQFCQYIQHSYTGLYECLNRDPAGLLRLQDLLQNQLIHVHEPVGQPCPILPGTIVATRILAMPQGPWMVGLHPYQFPSVFREVLLQRIHEQLRLRAPRLREQIMKQLAPQWHHWWLELVGIPSYLGEAQGLDKFRYTEDGEPLQKIVSYFRIEHKDTVHDILGNTPDFWPIGDHGFEWIEHTPQGPRRLGTCAFPEGMLAIQTMTPTRAQQAEARLSALLQTQGMCVQRVYEGLGHYWDTTIWAIHQQTKTLTGDGGPTYLESWLDHPNLSLDGLSPREASLRPLYRPRVQQLLAHCGAPGQAWAQQLQKQQGNSSQGVPSSRPHCDPDDMR